MSAPSSSTAAATYGVGTRCPWNGTFTTQNVVTVPVSGSATSVAVGTPQVGHAPRGGTYTLPQAGHRWPMILPC